MSAPLIPEGLGLEHDPEVYDAVKALALKSVAAAVDILDTAAPQQQLQMIRILIPRLTSSLKTASTDDKAELRDQVAGLYTMVSDALTDPHELDDLDSD